MSCLYVTVLYPAREACVRMLDVDDILIARDFSSSSNWALRHALDLAARTSATLHVFYADVLHEKGSLPGYESPAADIDDVRRELKDEPTSASDSAIDGVEVVEGMERDVSAAPAILNYASVNDVDVIALGTHGRRGPERVLIGSVAEEVVRRADCPALTIRGQNGGFSNAPGDVRRFLVPVDFSDASRQALRHAREIAQLYDAQIDLLHVVEEILRPSFYVEGLEENVGKKARDHLRTFVEESTGPDVDVEIHARSGQAASCIASFAEDRGSDLVVTSTHGRTGLQRLLLGSVAEKVLRHAHCPVLTVKTFGKSLIASDAS